MSRYRIRGTLMQQYLFGGELQLGAEDKLGPNNFDAPDLEAVVYELMCNGPVLCRGRRYKLLDGSIIEINGILASPAPEGRRAPGPSWDYGYWLTRRGPLIPEGELLDRLESTKFALGGETAPKPKKRKKRRS